jgi:tetratricopeptide (TPR) repeat protein
MALAIFRAQGHIYGELHVLFTMTQLARGHGDYDQMLSHAKRGLYLATRHRDRSFEGTIKSVIGGIHSDRGEYGRAIRNFKEALAIHKAWAQNITQLNLALVYWRVGDWPAARLLTEEAIVGARESDNQIKLCIVLLNYTLLLLTSKLSSFARN